MRTRERRIGVITGATGFIGSNLIKRLLELDWDVHLLVRDSSDLSVLSGVVSRVNVYKCDGGVKDMIHVLASVSPDCVFHIASNFLSSHTPEDVDGLVVSNLLYSTNLLEAMTVTGVQCIVNVGTSWQYYDDTVYNPVNLYAATKQAFEDILKYYTSACGIKAVTILLFDTYGPDDRRRKIVSLLWDALVHRKELIMSPGDQLIDLVYVSDVIDGFVLAANQLMDDGLLYSRYAISSGQPISLKNLVRAIEEVAGEKITVCWGGRAYRHREVMTPWSDYQLIPGWKAKVSLVDGLKNCDPRITI